MTAIANVMTPAPYKVLIVGCGNIAGGFDADRVDLEFPLTHAGAFQQHDGFVVDACVEPDAQRRVAFMQRWNIPIGYANMAALSAVQPGHYDVVSLCSPTALHAEQLQTVLKLAPRLVFCEKPVTPTLAETAAAVARCEFAGIQLAVNHTRRWAPDVQQLKTDLDAGRWGAVRAVTGTYNKGVLNNGSHMIDLLQLLLGPLQPVAVGMAVHDFWPDDPTIPALLRTNAGVPVQLATAHAADYALFELQIVTSNAVLTMEDGGQSWRVRQTVDSPRFRGYRSLDAGFNRPGRYVESMHCAVANLYAALHDNAPLACTGGTALDTQRLCQTLREMALGTTQAATIESHQAPAPAADAAVQQLAAVVV